MRMRIMTAVLLATCTLAVPVLFAEEVPQENGESAGIFSGDIAESAWTLLWFAILLIVLWKFAWKPMLAGLNSRTEHIEKQIDDAEKTRTEAKKVLEEYNAKLADAERQGRDIISARTKQAEQQAKEAHQKTQKELEEKKVRAEADLRRERNEAEDGLWDQAGDIVRQLGQDVFSKSLDDADNQKLINEAIARLKEQQGQ